MEEVEASRLLLARAIASRSLGPPLLTPPPPPSSPTPTSPPDSTLPEDSPCVLSVFGDVAAAGIGW